ncbi:MAG: hypothetical protein Q9215_003583 [Flavoplaca cf. flavocitrina]
MTEYSFTPLNEEAGEIRLLELLPGPFNAPICITLKITVLSRQKIPKFKALSYAWGNAQDRVRIHVVAGRGVQGVKSAALNITRSLAEALRHLRQKRQSMVFWIDQICVDQTNLEERGNQVLRMPDIFTLAKGVVVWLGPKSDDSEVAIEILNKIGPDVEVDWASQLINTSSTFYSRDRDLSPEQCRSITILLSRAWFDRLWVVQEICLTRQRIWIVCGFSRISFANFGNATCYLSGFESYGNDAMREDLFAKHIKLFAIKSSGVSSLDWTLSRTRHRECSDARDKVYAVLSMLPETAKAGIYPDYTISAPEVFAKIVLQQLDSQATLRMLRHASIKDSVPSWVPDWSTNPEPTPTYLSCADLNARAHANSTSQGVLTLTGVCVTVAHEVNKDLPRIVPEDRMESAKVIRYLLTSIVGKEHSGSNLSKLHSLCLTLCARMFAEKHFPPDHGLLSLKKFNDYYTCLYKWVSLESAEPPELCSSTLKVIRHINWMIKGKMLFVTADRRLGLAPEATVSGDLVCVILGCPCPLILRPSNNSSHEVVGECYIDGIMDGGALLGELPKNWMLVQKIFPELHGYYVVLFDSETQRIHLHDPRLGPLPAGWRIENHKNDYAYNWFLNDITGEATRFDPRLEPEALKARGVDLREFRLI